jgi:dTDP-4-dehydrorhamnose reductase
MPSLPQNASIVIVGAGGKVGSALTSMILAETTASVRAITSRELKPADRLTVERIDVHDRIELKRAVMSAMPTAIINCAAMTAVDACETDRAAAWAANVTLVEQLARLCRITDSRLIQLSTDYVFDGEEGPYDEKAIPRPINYYGRTKLAGENAALSGGVDAAIVRTNVVYGHDPSHHDFVQWVLSRYTDSSPFTVVDDQWSNPTFVDDVALAVLRILERRRTGIYHVGGADYVSRIEFARRIATLFRLDASLIRAIHTSDLQQPAPRPLKGGLITIKAESELSMRFTGIEAGLVTARHRMFEG